MNITLNDLKCASKKRRFTLIELIVVLAILTIIVMAGFQFFSATQNTWNISETKRETFENARIALDLISRDLESAYYGDGTAPFWHWGTDANGLPIRPSAWGEYRNELLAFVSDTPIPPNDQCTSTLCEVKYQLYFATTHDIHEGWIRRSVTGNRNDDGSDNLKWNYLNNLRVGYQTSSNIISSNRYSMASLTADNSSSGNRLTDGTWVDYQNVIPFALDLSFYCDSGSTGKLSHEVLADTNTAITTNTAASVRKYDKNDKAFPSQITITITLMDRASWNKWITLQGNSVFPTNETSTATAFRVAHQLTFKRSVFIGDRGGQQ
ncbi:MAG: type II secretion system protein [Lentisphaerota bacterium]